MDYEDNDFQSQSFQLAVEENVKFSSGSHSYSLPKFDLDDNLQVHLRFDSLVESEVLLGIQSQEENQWIEDFSRESSGLEFSSSAAESCSISRRNNVWSEATSSESVDLLLKSVGQDEMMMEQATVTESNVCDEFDGSTNQINPNLHQDGSSPSNMENVGSMSKLNEPVEKIPGLNIDAVDQLPQTDSLAQNDKGKRSVDGGLRVLNLIEEEKSRVLFSNVMGPKKDMGLFAKSDGSKPVDCSETLESRQVNPIIASARNFVNAEELNSEIHQRPEGLETGIAVTLVNHEVLTRVMDSQTCEKRRDDTDESNLGNLSSLVEKVDPVTQISEVSSDAIPIDNTVQVSPAHISLFKDTDMADQFMGTSQEASLLVAEEENVSVAHSPFISAGNSENLSMQMTNVPDQTVQVCSNGTSVAEKNLSQKPRHQLAGEISSNCTERSPVEEKTVTQSQVKDISNDHVEHSADISAGATEVLSMQIIHTSDLTRQECGNCASDTEREDISENVVHQLDSCISLSNTGRIPAVEIAVSLGQEIKSGIANVEHSSSILMEMCSSTEMRYESQKLEDMNDSDGGLEVPCPEACGSSSVVVESLEICDRVSVEAGPSFVRDFCPDSCAQENEKFPSDSEPAEVAPEAANIALNTVLDGAHQLNLRSDIADHASGQLKEDLGLPSHVEDSCLLAEQEETLTRVTILDMKDISQISIEELTSTESEHGKACDSSIGRLAETVGHFSSSMGIHDKVCESEPESNVVNIDAQRQHSEQSEDLPGIQDVAMKDKEGAEVGKGDNEEVSVSVEGVSASHESPIHSSPASLMEQFHDTGIKGLEENKASEANDVMRAALASLEGAVSHQTQTRSLPPIVESSSDTGLQDLVDEALESKNPSQSLLTSIQGVRASHGSPKHTSPASLIEHSIDTGFKNLEDSGASEANNVMKTALESLEGAVSRQTLPHSLPPSVGESSSDIGLQNMVDEASENQNCSRSPLTSTQGVSASHESPNHSSIASLTESSLDMGTKDLEDNRTSEANVTSTALASLEGAACQQTLTHSLVPSIEESSSDIGVQNLVDEASENKNGPRSSLTCIQGVPLNVCEEMIQSAALSECNAEGHVLEPESNNLNSGEPNCGSPTIISCSEASQSEKVHQGSSRGSLDSIDCDALEQEANRTRHSISDHKNGAFEDDRSFTFKVSSLVDSSQKEQVGGWKPFPSIHPYQTPQKEVDTGTSTPRYSEVNPMIEDMACASPQISGETTASDSIMCSPEEKPRLVTANDTRKETAEEGSQDDEVIYGEKEQKEGARSSDSNVAVPSRVGGLENVQVSTVRCPTENIAAEADRKFAFEVSSIAKSSEKQTCYGWKPVHSVQPHEFPQTVGVSSPSPPFIRQIDAKALQESSHGCRPQTSGAKSVRRSHKGNAEDKRKVSSGKAADKENEKGKLQKELNSMKHTKASVTNFICTSPASPAAVTSTVQAAVMPAVGCTEMSSIKSCGVSTLQTSNLPDLNSTASSSALFQQPFTDVQQVQLRAQIFVYGSIIQGTAPDESCMAAAFGESDRGRNTWEHVWRVTVEMLHSQKSPLSNAKSPPHQNTVAGVTETMRQTIHRSEAVCTPPTGADIHKISSAVLNSVMPISSPIWTQSAACRDGLPPSNMSRGPLFDSPKTLLPLQPYQSPQTRHFVGNTSPWPTQMHSPGSWVVASQTAGIDASVHHPTLPMSETVRVTAVREPSAPHHSHNQQSHPSPFVHTSSPPSGLAGISLTMDAVKTTVSPSKNASAESKPRKKRKNLAPEEAGQTSCLVQSLRDTVSFNAQSSLSVAATTVGSTKNVMSSITAQLPASVATTSRTSGGNVAYGGLFPGTLPVSPMHHQILSGGKMELRVTPSEEMCGRIEQAKRHAEDAAASAATAVRHCQNIWSQLAVQEKSGVVSDYAAKLESSAAAVAAASAVAKAAAAVAKVASDAAVQAKLLSDEALATSKTGNLASVISYHDNVNSLGRASPLTIKGREQAKDADSALVVVKETARRRAEAASAAAKRTENLNAVLKAAEMTAEAVSQAGTVIAMGEPLPFSLSELVGAGPDGYWKLQQKSFEQLLKSDSAHPELTYHGGTKEAIGRIEQPKEKRVNEKETSQTVELSKGSAENKMLLVSSSQQGSVSSSGMELEARKGSTYRDFSKIEGVTPESQAVSENASITTGEDKQHPVRTLHGSSIQEGSLVEVRSDDDGLKMVWYLAKVLSLKDGKALVSYIEHANHEGSNQLTELVPLDDKEGNAPKIRIPHPLLSSKHDGTKKRSRSTRGDYMWLVGDKVDALIRNGWWEGIVTEKSKDDETNFTIRFPVQNETSVVKAWNLRPSLVWVDGKWIEWCRSMDSNNLSNEGGTPLGKPSKKSRIESQSKPDPPIEAKEKEKPSKLPTITETPKPEPPKSLPLSAKEKVFNPGKKPTEKPIIGVPKPGGRKRKFMDVSKHYVSDKSSDPVKFAKYLIPQDSAPGPKTSSSRIISKGKRIVDSKPPAFKSGKLGNFPKNNNNKLSDDPKLIDIASESQSSKKKFFSSSSSDVKATPVKNVGNDQVGSNTSEPRRSNRRIQPTSRLLEGLQSSYTVSRIPSASHDKGNKVLQKSTRGRSHG